MKSVFFCVCILLFSFYAKFSFSFTTPCDKSSEKSQICHFSPYAIIENEDDYTELALTGNATKGTKYNEDIATFNAVEFTITAESIYKRPIFYALLLVESKHSCKYKDDTILDVLTPENISVTLDEQPFELSSKVEPGLMPRYYTDDTKDHKVKITFPEIPRDTQTQMCEGSLTVAIMDASV